MDYIARIRCSDAQGLVHSAAGVFAQAGCNVVENEEFVDPETGTFFMRTGFTGSDVSIPDLSEQLRHKLPPGARLGIRPRSPRRVVILATKEYHCLGELLLRHRFGHLGAEVSAIISNHSTLSDLVSDFHLPFVSLSHQGMTREAHEQLVAEEIEKHEPEFVILAKYMRILSPDFVGRFAGKLINIHHSFLPAFVGANPYRQAHDRGVKLIGATAHFVNEELDEGPIITQDVTRVHHGQSIQEMKRLGRHLEVKVLSQALDLVFDDRVFINGKRTVVFG